MQQFKDSMLKLIIETSTNLPPDARRAILAAREQGEAGNAGDAGARDHRHECGHGLRR